MVCPELLELLAQTAEHSYAYRCNRSMYSQIWVAMLSVGSAMGGEERYGGEEGEGGEENYGERREMGGGERWGEERYGGERYGGSAMGGALWYVSLVNC